MMPGNFPAFHNMTQGEAFAWAMAPTPGIRCTLTQNVAVATADVTGATHVYGEPVNGGVLPMFQDAAGIYPCIRKLPPGFLDHTLGTVTSGIGYDFFTYDNSGNVGIEKLAWTSSAARATAVDLVNGRYYKHADYSRLLVASILTTSTTTTEDSNINRYLFNFYNQVARTAQKGVSTNHTYNSSTERDWNASSTDTACNFMLGIVEQTVDVHCYGQTGNLTTSTVNGTLIPRLNGVSYANIGQLFFGVATPDLFSFTPFVKGAIPVLGLNTAILREADYSTVGGYYSNGYTSALFKG